MNSPIPVTVIGGYLGSGKTTLVNHLLRNANGKRLAIMVNEFGELAIDEDLIEASSENMISLAGGCVCCSFGSDLIAAMQELARMEPVPDNVILEASGVALPGAIAGTLSLLPGFALDGVLVLADAETVRQTAADKYMADTITRQLSDADIVLLNKTDLVSETELVELRVWLPQFAPDAQVIETQRSVLNPVVVLQNFMLPEHSAYDGPFQHVDGFETRRLDVNECVDALGFAEELIRENPGLVRAKGFVRDNDGSTKTIQIVGQRYEISAAPEGVNTGLVLIAKVM
ncbi:MAG: CobW family GTP-binding protein [Thiolinea sp.]